MSTGPFANLEKNHNYEFLLPFCQNNVEEAKKRTQETIEKVNESHHVYVCIQKAMFLHPRIQSHKLYETQIKPQYVKPDFKLLELGCCFGTDTRKIIADGCEPSKISVSDLHDFYWTVGKTVLFKDNLNVGTEIFGDFASVLDSNHIAHSHNLISKFSVVSAQMILHVLSSEQVEYFLNAALECLKDGGVLIGTCAGRRDGPVEEGETPTKGLSGRQSVSRIWHSAASLTALMEKLFTKVEVSEIKSTDDYQTTGSHIRLMFHGWK